MNKRLQRGGVVVLPILAFGALVPAGTASAASPGTDISAVSSAPCEVTFEIVNRTNSTFYTIDFRVDGEELTGPDYGSGPTGRLSVHSEVPEGTPTFPSVGYRNDLPPFTSSRTENLADLGYPEKQPDETYNVEYRMILGPNGPDRHPTWQSVEVPGCATPPPEPGGSSGSSGSSSSSSVDIFDLLAPR